MVRRVERKGQLSLHKLLRGSALCWLAGLCLGRIAWALHVKAMELATSHSEDLASGNYGRASYVRVCVGPEDRVVLIASSLVHLLLLLRCQILQPVPPARGSGLGAGLHG